MLKKVRGKVYNLTAQNSSTTVIRRSIEAIDNCLFKEKQKCLEAPIRVIKFIRLRMPMIEKILPLYPNMKVIYLQRDPRGSFNSRAHAGLIKGGVSEFRKDVVNHCNESVDDITTFRKLTKQYPERLKAVLYEDVAESPVETLSSIFRFCEMILSSDLRKYTLSLTSLGGNDSCAYCIKRGNSKKSTYKWRKEMSFSKVQFIDKQCSEVYSILGYRQFPRPIDLKNVSLSTRTRTGLIL